MASMAIPLGLIPIFKEKALKLRQEFQELNCCNSNDDLLEWNRLEQCLTIAKNLVESYDEIYSDILNDNGLQHEIRKLNSRRSNFVKAYKQCEESPKDQDVFKMKHCLEFACRYMSEFDRLLQDLSKKVFE